ncbi:glycosyltransferase family 4 protein [Crocosphaera sp.]|uniref:glycosyltransferase family 4 protein n=1 Tax=Crocosphaera sp. TaxID=2729996 RepID=UPI003F214789|nr:glycosyltransferase family 4 protein [Crocosphaera sp.]
MSKGRIAVIGVKGLPAQQGGIERYCQQIYPRVVQQGYEVDLYARSSYTQSSRYINRVQGVRVISLPSFPLKGCDAFLNSLLAMLIAIFGNYDIIHVHALGPCLWCWLGKLFSNAKIIVTCHGLDWQRAKWGKWSSRVIRFGEKIAVIWADEIIVVSQFLRQYFQQTYQQPTHYIPTAPSPYTTDKSPQPYLQSLSLEPKKYILFLGRLVPEKRPDLLIRAFQRLQPPGWKLVLAGGHSDTQNYYRQLKQAANDNPNICFTGEIQGDLLSEMMRKAGLFVLPSDLEGLPLVLLEAMQEGIPVVASNIAPHRQLIGSDRGLLFKKGNLNACVNCLETALNSPEKLQELSENAQTYVKQNHNWDDIVAQHLLIYSSPRKTAEIRQKESSFSNELT